MIKLPFFLWNEYIQKALATAILSKIEIKGIAITEEPKCVIISGSSSVLLPIVVSNGGIFTSGNPGVTWPVDN